jgi:hypothetical protein
LLLAATAAAADDSLGTLFLTPEERARLDGLRRGDAAATPGETRSREHSLTGFVQRSDGRTTVWIDGRAVVVPARGAPPLDPRFVQDEPGHGDGVRVERTETR